MTLRKVLLGTTALLGVGTFYAGSVKAADLEVTTGGFLRFGVAGGDLDSALGTEDVRDYDFYTDNEIHFDAQATDDQTGITYGGKVELEADTNSGGIIVSSDDTTGNISDVSAGDQIDEAWLFMKGGFGELQLGDNDGATDQLKFGAYSIAAGTGGIDGDGPVATVPLYHTNTGDATKVTYFSPDLFGAKLGVSFTPDGGGRGSTIDTDTQGNTENVFEGAVQYDASFGGFDVALGATGIIGGSEAGGTDPEGYSVGAVTSIFGFSVAGQYFDNTNDDAFYDYGWNVGIGGTFGPADVSVNYGYADSGDDNEDLVFSATVGLLPGVALNGDVALFSTDTDDLDVGDLDDTGLTGVIRLDINL
ncbi:MAG: porin [Geminicoccaceae bacterium]|nr:porin [Geminicoccaceae bacterium]